MTRVSLIQASVIGIEDCAVLLTRSVKETNSCTVFGCCNGRRKDRYENPESDADADNDNDDTFPSSMVKTVTTWQSARFVVVVDVVSLSMKPPLAVRIADSAGS